MFCWRQILFFLFSYNSCSPPIFKVALAGGGQQPGQAALWHSTEMRDLMPSAALLRRGGCRRCATEVTYTPEVCDSPPWEAGCYYEILPLFNCGVFSTSEAGASEVHLAYLLHALTLFLHATSSLLCWTQAIRLHSEGFCNTPHWQLLPLTQ